MAENNITNTVESLLKGIDGFLSTKTVVGEVITVGDTVVVPLVDVSFAVGAGALAETSNKRNAGGGAGGKITPNSVLVIQNGTSKLISVRDQSGLTKLLDLVPDLVNKFVDKDEASEEELEDVKEIFAE